MSTKKRVIAFEIISLGTPRLMTMRVVGQDASQVQSRHYMDTRCYSPAAWNTPSLCPWPTTPHQDPAQVRATEPKRVRPSRILNGEKSNRVSTGIPGYGLRMEMIRKFFSFPLWKRFRKSGILERFPERFFFVNRKFPERCSGIPDRYGIPERSGISGMLRKFPECSGISFRKFSGKIVLEISGTIGTRIKLKPLRLM